MVDHASSLGKADPNVRLPEAVRRSAERANAIAQAEKDKREGKQAASEVVTPESNPPQPENRSQEPQFEPQSTVTISNFDPNNPRPPEPVVPEPQPADYEHQFKSLKGRYERTEAENRRITAQISEMQKLMASLQSLPAPAPQNNGQTGSGVRFSGPITGQRLVTAKDQADYGDDLIDLIGRRAMEIAAPAISQMQAELEAVKRQVGGVRQTVVLDGREKLYDTLQKEMPNWEAINDHPEFVRWLSMPDPLSGQIRHTMLDEAFNGNQTTRVLQFFNRFLADQASYGPANGGPQPGNGRLAIAHQEQKRLPPPSPQVDLAALAAPGRAKPGQAPATPEKPIVTAAEIKAFYKDVTDGRFVGRDNDYNAIQKIIFEAGNEGRIVR